MEFGKSITKFRKKCGLSQERLAEEVGVARQTISKWELGETAPDLKQAKALSEIFKVSLDELTGNDIKDVLIAKTSNTEKLAGIILKLLKFAIAFMIIAPILLIAARLIVKHNYAQHSGRLMNVSIQCTIHDKEYGYEFNYYESTGDIKEAGGDAYLANNVGFTDADDAYAAIDIIDAYAKDRGGSCEKTEPKPVEE